MTSSPLITYYIENYIETSEYTHDQYTRSRTDRYILHFYISNY